MTTAIIINTTCGFIVILDLSSSKYLVNPLPEDGNDILSFAIVKIRRRMQISRLL